VYEIPSCVSKFLSSLSILWLIVISLDAQNPRIDSLKAVVEDDASDKYSTLIALTKEVGELNDNLAALEYCVEAEEIAYDIGDTAKIVESGRLHGQLLNRLDRSREASALLLRLLPIAKRSGFNSDYKLILNNLAIAYTFQAKYDEALKYHFENLVLREADGDKYEISVSLNNIGLVYFKLKNYDKSIANYIRALNYRKESGDHSGLDRLYINTGLCYNQLREFEKAKESFDQGFKECSNPCAPQIQIEGNFGLGVAFYGLKEHSAAREYFNKSLSIARTIGNSRFQAENLIYIAHIDVREERYDDALQSLKVCESIAKAGRFNELLIESYKEFSHVYTFKNDFEKASAYQQQYT
jgi:tetratricopeptide (TPR) repeat protein